MVPETAYFSCSLDRPWPGCLWGVCLIVNYDFFSHAPTLVKQSDCWAWHNLTSAEPHGCCCCSKSSPINSLLPGWGVHQRVSYVGMCCGWDDWWFYFFTFYLLCRQVLYIHIPSPLSCLVSKNASNQLVRGMLSLPLSLSLWFNCGIGTLAKRTLPLCFIALLALRHKCTQLFTGFNWNTRFIITHFTRRHCQWNVAQKLEKGGFYMSLKVPQIFKHAC